ncbi:phospholipase D/nuclease [Myriangium duriaei CBS 260.36]|uniref:Phospholipase D/nuclease n=1 Tax=Myriangium duriaei CBS 260.36 TaxID=1168546 RepID=A0A9P4J6J0_9PEZI|nr:phospholipase D/nuclease [Myriangium duriaei CBS 260.36]
MDSATTQSLLSTLSASKYESLLRRPNYWTSDPAHLLSTCDISDVLIGTGANIYSSLQSALESTESELVLVTCFWARSASLDTLCATLRHLSAKSLSRGGSKIRVRICVSSVSLWQKLFHTQSLEGYIYPPFTWEVKLGLPPPNELTGLDLQIKSIFVKPFSVMHPKFIIIDRQKVFLPSCNVSWEDWFEGCIGLSGDVVHRFVEFWEDFWRGAESIREIPGLNGRHLAKGKPSFVLNHSENRKSTDLPTLTNLRSTESPCVFLPSPHNINPKFRLPWQSAVPAPNTPLNTFLLAAFRAARRNIYIQTPNLTAPPVLLAILQTLKRGIHIHIVTSERLMIIEQLVTAGTTTSRCVSKLVKRYGRARHDGSLPHYSTVAVEEGRAQTMGHLKVEYYRPTATPRPRGQGGEPVQSHLKLTIVDDELVVLGSGNLDRASWYTSQELGIAIFEAELAVQIRRVLDEVLDPRKSLFYDSRGV